MITLLPLLFLAAPKADQTTYPLNAQVQQASLVNICGTTDKGSDCGYVQHLTVLMDGKHYQLNGTAYSSDILQAGQYKARIQKDDSHGQTYNRTLIYRLLFPDGKTADFLVVGQDQ
jgi:hypothetical protein